MRAFVLLCAAVAAITIAAPSAHADTCQLKLISSLTLTESGDDVFVPVSVAGKHVQFKFELADAYTGIAAKAAKGIGLAEHSLSTKFGVEMDGKPITTRVTVPELQIDKVVARNIDLLEFPSLSDGEDGILGLDILAANDLELDLAHHRANLFLRDHCVGKVVYWNPPEGAVAAIPLAVQKSGNITVDMSLDGQPVSVAIMTADRSAIEMLAAHRIFGIDENSPDVQALEVAENGHLRYRYPFHEIDVQGLKIENPDIIVEGKRSDPDCNSRSQFLPHPGGTFVSCYGGADLFLGVSVLRRLHLFFAFGEKILYVTAASD